MLSKKQKERLKYIREATFCIAAGTGAGLIVYGIFLYFNIAIFGWNLGLIFAPLIAGYVETILANKIIGEDIGAISAFILFAHTTFYSFILKNPTLGFNLITIGSIAVILQAAFPTLINYILLVVVVGALSYILGIFKRITRTCYEKIMSHTSKEPRTIETIKIFSEEKSNETLNSLDFIFFTSSDFIHADYESIGVYASSAICEINKRLVNSNQKTAEKVKLNNIKECKDECLIRLAEKIKSHGGNGVIGLSIYYNVTGIGLDKVEVNASGVGVIITKNQ